MAPARIMLIINAASLQIHLKKEINVGLAYFTNWLVNTKCYGN